jgi:hypothetical protein
MNKQEGTMPSVDGRSNQLVKAIGEFAACTELARQGYIASPFAGNVPDFDLVASDAKLRAIHIQVKATRSQWQFSAEKYIKIDRNDKNGTQKVAGKVKLSTPDLIHIMVQVGEERSKDKFYLLTHSELQNLIYIGYKKNLKRHKGRRPKKPESTHHAVSTDELYPYKNNWELLD